MRKRHQLTLENVEEEHYIRALQGSLYIGHYGLPRTSLKQQKKHQGVCGSRGVMHCVVNTLGTHQGLITPSWLNQTRGFADLMSETPYNPGVNWKSGNKSILLMDRRKLLSIITKHHNKI